MAPLPILIASNLHQFAYRKNAMQSKKFLQVILESVNRRNRTSGPPRAIEEWCLGCFV
jgi:hypothetical protein